MALAAGATNGSLAERYGVHRETIRRFRQTHDLGKTQKGRDET